MKKLLSTVLIAGVAMAGNFYIGGGVDLAGAGKRTYDTDSATVDFDVNRNDKFALVGYKYSDTGRIEIEYRTITLKNKDNSSDKDTVTSIGVNFITHRKKPIWRLKPYIKGGLAYVKNDVTYTDISGSTTSANGLGMFAELGTYIEITKHVELSVGYEVRMDFYEEKKNISTYDSIRGFNIAAYYHF